MKITFKTPIVSLALGVALLGAMFSFPAVAETIKTSAGATANVAPNKAFNEKIGFY